MKENQLSKKNTPGISCSFCETSNYAIFFFFFPDKLLNNFALPTPKRVRKQKTETRGE